jgi:hypothetical protein
MPERTTPPKPHKSPEEGQKSIRLAAALRANLARRKAQSRDRTGPEQGVKQQG